MQKVLQEAGLNPNVLQELFYRSEGQGSLSSKSQDAPRSDQQPEHCSARQNSRTLQEPPRTANSLVDTPNPGINGVDCCAELLALRGGPQFKHRAPLLQFAQVVAHDRVAGITIASPAVHGPSQTLQWLLQTAGLVTAASTA
jgi:hypothetical protein